MVVIKAKKFTLRPYRKGDEASIVKHANDKIIARNTLVMPHPYTMKDARVWVKKNLIEYKKKNKKFIAFAIDINSELCGAIGLHEIKKEHKAEIGYWLGRNYWGQGVMTEAVKLATKFAFDNLKLRRVYAHVFLFNKPSRRVLEKAGYKFEGIIKKEAKKGNKYLDSYLLAKVR